MMNKETRKKIFDMKTIGYWSCLSGVEVKYIDYNLDEVICISSMWDGKRCYHRVKLNYDKQGVPFIKIKGKKLSFDECLRP